MISCWVGVASKTLPSTSGETFERGMLACLPFFPLGHHHSTGKEQGSGASTPILRQCSISSSESSPLLANPPRSPFTSPIRQGTPFSLRRSAISFRDTLFPEPLPPETKPCRTNEESGQLISPASLLAIFTY